MACFKPRSPAGSECPGGLGLASMLFGILHPISISYMVLAAFSGSISVRSGSWAATF